MSDDNFKDLKPLFQKIGKGLRRLLGRQKGELEADDIDLSIKQVRGRKAGVERDIRDIQKEGTLINIRQREIDLEKERLDNEYSSLVEEEKANAEAAMIENEERDKINALLTELLELKDKYEALEA